MLRKFLTKDHFMSLFWQTTQFIQTIRFLKGLTAIKRFTSAIFDNDVIKACFVSIFHQVKGSLITFCTARFCFWSDRLKSKLAIKTKRSKNNSIKSEFTHKSLKLCLSKSQDPVHPPMSRNFACDPIPWALRSILTRKTLSNSLTNSKNKLLTF